MPSSWFYNRSIFFQLMTGALSILFAGIVIWAVVDTYCLSVVDRVNARRWHLSQLERDWTDVRANVRDFMLNDVADPRFYATGRSAAIDRIRARFMDTRVQIDSVAAASDLAEVVAQPLHERVRAYEALFDTLATAYRQRGIEQPAHTNVRHDSLQRIIGATDQDGIRRRLRAAGDAMGPLIDDLTAQVAKEAAMARRNSLVIPLTALIVGVVIAAIFFYFFAVTISKTIQQYGRAADEVGNGRLNVRLKVQSGSELGQFAAAFNRMVDNLSSLIGVVQASGMQISTSAMEIAATSRQQQATAHQVAQTTAEVEHTASTISVTSRALADDIDQVVTVAERTASLADHGKTGLARMDDAMRQVGSASQAVNERLAALSERAGSITSVVTVIAKVADQTNLLSLNAAIEAEKAGEYGRGFSVVATEIRRLADQTAAATDDIARIVKEMQSAVSAGVMGMDKFSDEVSRSLQATTQTSSQLSEIIHQVQAMTPLVERVGQVMQSHSDGAKHISDAITQLAASAHQTVDSLVQSTTAIDHLNDAANNLRDGVSRFNVMAA